MRPYIKINAAKDEEYHELSWKGNSAVAAANFTAHAVTDSWVCDESGNADVDLELVVAMGAVGGEVKFSVYNDVHRVREAGFGDPLIGEGTVHFKRMQRKDGNNELSVPLKRGDDEELKGHLVFRSWERQRREPRQIILGKRPILEIPLLRDHVATHWGLALLPVPEADRPMIAQGTLTTMPDVTEIAGALVEPMPTIAENAVALEDATAKAEDANAEPAGPQGASAEDTDADSVAPEQPDYFSYESTNAEISSEEWKAWTDIPIIIFGPTGVIAHSFPEEKLPMFMDRVVYNRIHSKEIVPEQEAVAREHMRRRGVDLDVEFDSADHLEKRKNNPDPEDAAYRKWWSTMKGEKLSLYTLAQHEVGFTLRTEEEIDAFIQKFILANPHYAMKTQCQTFIKSLHAFLVCDALGGLRHKSIDGFLDAVVGWSVLAGLSVAAGILSGPVGMGAAFVLASQKITRPH